MTPALDSVPQNRTNRMLLLILGIGLATGLHLGLLHIFLWRKPAALFIFVVPSLLFAGIIYALWRWVFPRLGGRTLAGQVVIQSVVSLLVMTALSVSLIEVIATLVLGEPSLFGTPTGPVQQFTITPEMRQMSVRIYSFLPVIPTVLMTMIGYHQYWSRMLSMQHRERQLTEMAATAQLAALRAQINPHFLFNSLNSIAQLIHSDPDAAEICVQRLADIFRYILRRAEKEFVPLSEELEMAEAYLAIERARFGDRLTVETRVDPLSLHHQIPNLILQPLVENAIKHGLSRKLGGGRVRIGATMADGLLELVVDDDGLGMAGATLAQVYERGVGLSNLRDRLARLYGPAHLPEITSAPNGGTQVRLRLPARPAVVAA